MTRRVAIPSIVLAILLGSCSPECAVEQKQSVASPDGRWVATVLTQNCHASSPLVTLVSVRCADCELDPDDGVFSIKGTPRVSPRWTGNGHLIIDHDEGFVYRQNAAWKDITISYQAVPATTTS